MNERPTTFDYKESSINYFHDSAKDLICEFYTSKESVKDAVYKRNPNCKMTHDGYGWILRYERDQVRHPKAWIKVANEVEVEED